MPRKKHKTSPPAPPRRKPRNLGALLGAGALLLALVIGGSVYAYVVLRPTAEKYYQRGLQLAREGKGAEAGVAWREAIHLDHKYAPPYLSLAEQAEQAGDVGAAIRALEVLHRYNPNVPHTLSHLAQLYGLANRFETALTIARKAVQAEPKDPNAHNALAMLLEMAGDHAHAAEALGTAHQLSPEDEALTLDYARVLALAGQPEKAFDLVEPIGKNPHTQFATQADYLMGWLLAEYGKKGKPDTEEALNYLQYTLKYEPNHIATNTEVGLIYARQGQDREALPYLERAVQLGPSNVEAIRALSGVYMRLGRSEVIPAMQSAEAVNSQVLPLRQARKRYVTHPEDRANVLKLAELEADSGNAGDALELAEQVLRATPNDPAALKLQKRLSSKPSSP